MKNKDFSCIIQKNVVPLQAKFGGMREKGLIILLMMVVLTSCGEYQKLLKSRDPEEKYQAALRYFNNKQYVKSQTLLDDVSAYYKGTERSEDILAYLDISLNEEVLLEVHEEGLMIRKKVQRKTLQEYAAEYGGKLGPYDEFDWGEGLGISRWLDE